MKSPGSTERMKTSFEIVGRKRMSCSYVTCLTHKIHKPRGQLVSVVQDTGVAARGFSSYPVLLYSGLVAHNNEHHHSTCQTRKLMCSSPPE